jgi:protein-tyrosine phosphatase
MLVPFAAPDATYALLVLDDDGGEARRFRSTSALPAMDGLPVDGLAALRCSGSAQPSVAAFRDVRRRLGEVAAEDLYVLDLRQESHGFLNEAAVSWYAEANWGAAGLPDEEALALEALRLRLLGLAERVRVGDVETIKRGAAPSFTTWERPRVAGEAEAFGLWPGRYVRLPVTDHARPSDEVVDRFVALVRGLPERAHIHLHCRGGKGRTATFIALHDLLRNAGQMSLEAILDRQAVLNGYDLRKVATPGSAKAAFIEERQAFVRAFHAYARETRGEAPMCWSAWVRARTWPVDKSIEMARHGR